MGKNLTKQRKNAVVIGATGNLGRAVCAELKKAGFNLDKTWLSANHPDATRPESYKNLPKKIHLAVYLPGLNIVKKIEDLEIEEWDKVMDVNLKGAFLFAKAAFPALKAAKGATLLVISSIMTTHPYPNRLPYAVSKAGLEGFTRSLAIDWGQHNIAVNCIRLGHLVGLMKSTRTNPELLREVRANTPSGELVDPMEVAKYIVWLASGGSKSLTGSIVDFDHAYTLNRWPL